MALKALQRPLSALHGVSGAQLGALVGMGVAGKRRSDLITLITHHQHGVPRRQEGQGIQNIAQQGTPARQAKDLGQIHTPGSQARPLPRRQNHSLSGLIHAAHSSLRINL